MAADGDSTTDEPTTYVKVMAPILFVICWILIAFKIPFFPIGRTAGTMLCAVLTVALGILDSDAAFAAVSLSTLGLLLGSMLMSSFLEREGLFLFVQKALCWRISNEGVWAGHQLLARCCLLAGTLSAVVTNDTCCVVLTPLLMGLVRRYGLKPTPFLLALATSANIGSSCSPVGNPQNMLIASASRLSFATFLSKLLLATLVSLSLNILFLGIVFHKDLVGKRIVWTDTMFERRTDEEEDEENKIQATNEGEQQLNRDERDGLLIESGNRVDMDSDGTNQILQVQVQPVAPPDEVDSSHHESFNSPPTDSTVSLLSSSDSPLSCNPTAASSSSSSSSSSAPAGLSVADRLSLADSARSQLAHTIDTQQRGLQLLDQAEESMAHNRIGHHPIPTVERPTSNQSYHTDLNLYDDSNRREYIRRLQLETFYGLESLNHSSDSDDHASSTVMAAPKMIYVTPKRYLRTNAMRDSNETTTTQTTMMDGTLHMLPADYTTIRTPIRANRFISTPNDTYLRRTYVWLRSQSKLRWFSLILFLTILSFFSGLSLAWCALGGSLLMILVDGSNPDETGIWTHGIDWALLLFFSGLFVVVEGLHASEWPQRMWDGIEGSGMDLTTFGGIFVYTIIILIGSNTVSNVPLVLILTPALQAMESGRDVAWILLAFVSTLAGNLTLVGSVANLIVAGRARKWHELTFVEYSRYGAPSTIVLITIGVAIIQAM